MNKWKKIKNDSYGNAYIVVGDRKYTFDFLWLEKCLGDKVYHILNTQTFVELDETETLYRVCD